MSRNDPMVPPLPTQELPDLVVAAERAWSYLSALIETPERRSIVAELRRAIDRRPPPEAGLAELLLRFQRLQRPRWWWEVQIGPSRPDESAEPLRWQAGYVDYNPMQWWVWVEANTPREALRLLAAREELDAYAAGSSAAEEELRALRETLAEGGAA